MSTETRVFPQSRIVLANLWVAIVAFGVAAAMAMMQAISRANLEVPYRSARMYYMSVTAHGVLMALVFTTFFIMGLGYATAQKEIGSLRAPRFAWASWIIARLGGWSGYATGRPAGPITIGHGLKRFAAILHGFTLSQNVYIR